MFPELFPAHTIASVWSGEISGKLDVILEDLATDMEREASDTRYGRIGWGLTKITLIGMIVTLPMFNMGTILAPVVNESPQAGTPQGYAASFLSVWMRQIFGIGVPIALAVIASWLIWGRIKRIPAVRRALDGMLLHVPVWGNVHRCRSMARFLTLLDHLYSAGISPFVAWDAACIGPRNSAIAEKLKLARRESSAVGIADMAALSGIFDPEDMGLIAAGEKTGQVPDSLSKLTEIYLDRAESARKVGKMWSISQLILFQIVVSGVALIVVAKSYAGVLLKLMP
jgi:type IV pilus assembly protein PilC